MTVKPATTFEDQLAKLKSRGCIVQDDAFALEVLKRINYYRLTAYFLPFKRDDDTYVDGTNFYTVYRIHEFDREIRNALLPIIEEIELMLRTRLSYYHAHKYGPLGYLDIRNFNARHKHDRFLETIERNISGNSKQLFVKHYLEKYGGNFPLWVLIELFTTGELSFFYSDMLVADKKIIARDLFNSIPDHVSSWLLCLTYLRNYCAHYSRLYYTLFPAIPALPLDFPYVADKRIFDYILVLKFLFPNEEKWSRVLIPRLHNILSEYSDAVRLKNIGFPINWENVLLS